MLVAIAIPVFATQLDKSQTDVANIRSAYAEVTIDVIRDETATNLTKEVTLKHTVTGRHTVLLILTSRTSAVTQIM